MGDPAYLGHVLDGSEGFLINDCLVGIADDDPLGLRKPAHLFPCGQIIPAAVLYHMADIDLAGQQLFHRGDVPDSGGKTFCLDLVPHVMELGGRGNALVIQPSCDLLVADAGLPPLEDHPYNRHSFFVRLQTVVVCGALPVTIPETNSGSRDKKCFEETGSFLPLCILLQYMQKPYRIDKLQQSGLRV